MEYRSKILSYNINTNCNLRCKMCGIPNLKRPELTTEEIKKVLDDLPPLGFEHIILAGGEPLLRKDIYELIEYGNRIGVYINPASNGTLITPEVAKSLAKVKCRFICVSIDGPKEFHDSIRGKGVFDRATQGLRNLRKAGVPAGMAMTLLRSNYRYACEMVELGRELGVYLLLFQPYCQYPGVTEETTKQLKPDAEDIIKFKKEYKKALRLLNMYNIHTGPPEFMAKIPEYFENDIKISPPPECAALQRSLVMEADGNVYPCFSLEMHRLGNIRESRISSLWNSKKHEEIRDLVRKGHCPGCVLTCYSYIFNELERDFRELQLGDACDNHCTLCPVLGRKGAVNKSTSEVAEELTEIRRGSPYATIVLTGGEPAIREDIFEILERAQALGAYYLRVKTNARKLSEKDFAERMVEFCTEFEVTLFGHTPEMHDRITGVPGSQKETLRGIQNLMALGSRVIVDVVVTSQNLQSLQEIQSLLAGLGVKEMKFSFLDETKRDAGCRDTLVPDSREACIHLNSAILSGPKMGIKVTLNKVSFDSMRFLQEVW